MEELINKLEDIESILLTFDKSLFEKDKTILKKEFNRILNLLRKPLLVNKWTDVFETPQDIINILIDKCNFKDDFAINKSRKREGYVDPRHIAQTICRYIFPNKSLAYVGSFFVNSDHATVLHSVKVVKNLCETNLYFLEKFNSIQQEILGYVYIKF